jgi:hypothetical protein
MPVLMLVSFFTISLTTNAAFPRSSFFETKSSTSALNGHLPEIIYGKKDGSLKFVHIAQNLEAF